MRQPKRIWWARPRKLCALERPGGGGRSHRPGRRAEEIEWLKDQGVRTVISTMRSRHNLAAYEEAGLRWHHVPAPSVADAEEQLDEVLRILRRELRRGGAVAIHGDRRTDFVAAACAACLADYYAMPLEESLERAVAAGLTLSDDALALVGAAVSV